MIHLRTDAIRTEWVSRVRESLRARGYYYEAEFCTETGDAQPVVTAAKLLGDLYVPSEADSNKPVILTQPSLSAPDWRPFDRKAAIGWHNDFSTRSGRPVLSVSWIRQGDPGGPKGGAWRVACAAAVLSKLCETREGKRLVADLSARAEPLGYLDAGGSRRFRVIIGADRRSGHRGLRFYGRALKEGALLRFGEVPERTHETIARVEEAADAVGEVLSAPTGSLLIVDNRFSLHDRVEQQVSGPEERRRQAWLCFVSRLHQPL
jgi:hypothetical protein